MRYKRTRDNEGERGFACRHSHTSVWGRREQSTIELEDIRSFKQRNETLDLLHIRKLRPGIVPVGHIWMFDLDLEVRS